MRGAFFSAKPLEKPFFMQADPQGRHALTYFEARLSAETAPLARGHDAVCAFVNDHLDASVLERCRSLGVRYLALRSAGFNHVVRVPAYSPHAVAEHAVALMLDLNRKIHGSYARVHEGNFSLDGLMGFDMHGRTAGIIGTGAIGFCVARILGGFGMKLLAYDPVPAKDAAALGVRYASLEELYGESSIWVWMSTKRKATFSSKTCPIR